ncbi:cation:proton antiporter regulatory subunit [Cytobacillus gottheilii]|uniref:TrkA C-terminal domain-containing protein n=1 Tax=Cytobacillus gottheilii TaxID=859144 RepID=A0ABX8FDI9_9BACI|nr:TrkA C-terminal domain-containing protein [Cytobacillus gottheilii]QVY62280.1 TrkA C-terminal domain-containing protein [Cytobacillus gottheilii]
MGFLFIGAYLAVVLIVIEISAMLFEYTGLDKQISRFQATSMLTGTGFTTGESELIIDHPIRRKICGFLIFFGAFSLAVIISAISNILADDFYTSKIAIIAGVLFILLLILKIPKIRKLLSKEMTHELEEKFDLQDMPMKDVFLMDEDDALVNYTIEDSSKYNGKLAKELIQEFDLTVLFIKRGEKIIRNDILHTSLHEGDILYLFGNQKEIEDAFGS